MKGHGLGELNNQHRLLIMKRSTENQGRQEYGRREIKRKNENGKRGRPLMFFFSF
jgi:hypothetical protein